MTKEVNSVKRTDKNVFINTNVVGIDNKVEVNGTINKSPSKIPAAIAIALGVVAGATILAVSFCCPEMLVDVVRLIIDVASGN